MSQYSNYNTFQWSEPLPWSPSFDVNAAPDKPGFYVFTDFIAILKPSMRPQHTVFYVGQTTDLRRRLKQHRDGIGQAGRRLQLQLVVWLSQGKNVYVRWAADDRAAIERDLINELRAVHNDELSEWS
jgi:hypothetical protein